MHELEHESIITLILVATLSDLVFIEYRSKGVQQRPVCTYILAQGLGKIQALRNRTIGAKE